jgi:alkanesulfonate monooxygenase SsuD/methylene tetrahydromethanopterin reductase-like flavin-dependent oxidoreductase (luciferase family)
MDQLEYAEALGFDGIGVNEHHQNGYGLMPSPNVIAGGLARRTSKDRFLPPLYAAHWQERLARSELVMLDGAGHMVPYEQPVGLARAVAQFLSGCSARLVE